MRIDAGRKFDRQHGAETALLSLGDVVAGVARKSRIIDARDALVARQAFGEQARRLLLPLNPCKERAKPAQRQIAVERRAGKAGAIRPLGKLGAEARIARQHGPADDIAMAVDVFRRRMQNDVAAESERVLQRRR